MAYKVLLPANHSWIPSRTALARHSSLIAGDKVMVPALNDETWDWLSTNVRSPFQLCAVCAMNIDDDDLIVFSDYQEYLHFKLRWAEVWG